LSSEEIEEAVDEESSAEASHEDMAIPLAVKIVKEKVEVVEEYDMNYDEFEITDKEVEEFENA